MPEVIRFAWGISSLGDFMVAMSDKGIVALEFSSQRSAMEDASRLRFQEADFIDGQADLGDVLVKVEQAIENPGLDPNIPLDLRGTPYQIKVWSMLGAIPMGETTNYGALAANWARAMPER
jgi:AraC family transcriptional regulator of adaptative response/methylated-DNA-[protein]-cysteine methyltransferase